MLVGKQEKGVGGTEVSVRKLDQWSSWEVVEKLRKEGRVRG